MLQRYDFVNSYADSSMTVYIYAYSSMTVHSYEYISMTLLTVVHTAVWLFIAMNTAVWLSWQLCIQQYDIVDSYAYSSMTVDSYACSSDSYTYSSKTVTVIHAILIWLTAKHTVVIRLYWQLCIQQQCRRKPNQVGGPDPDTSASFQIKPKRFWTGLFYPLTSVSWKQSVVW